MKDRYVVRWGYGQVPRFRCLHSFKSAVELKRRLELIPGVYDVIINITREEQVMTNKNRPSIEIVGLDDPAKIDPLYENIGEGEWFRINTQAHEGRIYMRNDYDDNILCFNDNKKIHGRTVWLSSADDLDIDDGTIVERLPAPAITLCF